VGTSPPRPTPARPGITAALERGRQWYEWFGPGRIAVATVSAVAMVAGGAWLLRVPQPPAVMSPVSTNEVPVFTLAPLGPVPDSIPLEVVVHVAGAVWRPGVYGLPSGSRVIAAIEAAGGTRLDAVVDAMNLASVVVDGQRIYVPVEGEEPFQDLPANHSIGDVPGASPQVALVDLNRATVAELTTLPGVGPATAAAIVDDRVRNGPYFDVDDLLRVRGIGPIKVENLRLLVKT
jgi:competence protein ComEA